MNINQQSINRQRALYVASDLLTTAVAWFLFNLVRYHLLVVPVLPQIALSTFLTSPKVIAGQILIPIGMLGLYFLSGYYRTVFLKSRIEEFIKTLATAIIGAFTIYFIALVDDISPQRSESYYILFILSGLLFVMVYAGRLLLTSISNRKIRRGEIYFNTLIVGTSQSARRLRQALESFENLHSYAYRIVGFVEDDKHPSTRPADLPIFPQSDLANVCRDNEIASLVVTSHHEGLHSTIELVNRLYRLERPILLSPTLFELIATKPRLDRLVGEPLIDLTKPNMSDSTATLKRCIDVVFSIIVMILLTPVWLIIGLLIKLDSPGPVFYSQERIGYHKKPFNIYKFRTMQRDAEADGPALSSKDDRRVTRVGAFLRKYRLDELPQFWNVIKGDMSLIGPRPERQYYIDQIIERAPYYMLIHQVRPGITSLGMVKFGYASNINDMIERLSFDIAYLENISLLNDLKIALYTIRTILKGSGV